MGLYIIRTLGHERRGRSKVETAQKLHTMTHSKPKQGMGAGSAARPRFIALDLATGESDLMGLVLFRSDGRSEELHTGLDGV